MIIITMYAVYCSVSDRMNNELVMFSDV